MDTETSALTSITRFALHRGAVEDFTRLARRCVEVVRAQDTGTEHYEVFLDAERSEAVIIERYRDSQAVLDHLAHVGQDLMDQVMATGEVTQRGLRAAQPRAGGSAGRRPGAPVQPPRDPRTAAPAGRRTTHDLTSRVAWDDPRVVPVLVDVTDPEGFAVWWDGEPRNPQVSRWGGAARWHRTPHHHVERASSSPSDVSSHRAHHPLGR